MDENALFVNSRMTPGQLADVLQNLSDILKADDKPVRGRGYFLSKVPSRKNGFTYYVRYYDRGMVIPSRWSTGTNDPVTANVFAVKNRGKKLNAYYRGLHEPREKTMYSVMRNYYKSGSEYLAIERNRGRKISDHTAGAYYHFVVKRAIPFLRRNGVRNFDDITPPLIAKMQNCMLLKNKPQTVNYFIGGIKKIFDHLVTHGSITENVFKKIEPLIVPDDKKGTTGCHDISDVKGVFNKRWPDPLSYMLCLLIYTTNLRNNEIEKIKMADILKIGPVYFIDIKESKTKNGVRLVPLHPFVYKKIVSFAGDNNGFLFLKGRGKTNQSTVYREAADMMGTMMGKTSEYMEKERIAFYSGRSYWKTLMNAGGLGDVEEYFMGHKVSSDVAKRYNHKDKQGRDMLVKKAREVFAIFDKRLFTSSRLSKPRDGSLSPPPRPRSPGRGPGPSRRKRVAPS
jgi:integrase